MNTRSKFNVNGDKTNRTCDGIVFDSEMEMRYYRDVLIPAIEDGTVVGFERQKKYTLQHGFVHDGKKVLPIDYKADFTVKYADGREEVIDIKGCADAVALLKRKMFWHAYPDVNYIWIGYSKVDSGWNTYENIMLGRKQRRKLKEQKKKEKQDGKESKGDRKGQ